MQALDTWLVATILAKWIVYACALIAAGGAWFSLSQPALAPGVRRGLGRVTALVAALGIVATLARLAVQAGYLIDDGWRGAIDPAMLALAADGPLGTASAMRIIGLALAALLVLPGRATTWAAAAGASLVAISFSLTGHASVAAPGAIAAAVTALLALHVAAASFWVGALWPLHRMAGDASARSRAARSAERFGRQAAWTVGALALAGAALSWVLLGSFEASYTTGYGRALLAKTALVGALLGLAALNKWRLAPALGGADPAAAGNASMSLRRSIVAEAALVAGVLLATAVLTGSMLPPSR